MGRDYPARTVRSQRSTSRFYGVPGSKRVVRIVSRTVPAGHQTLQVLRFVDRLPRLAGIANTYCRPIHHPDWIVRQKVPSPVTQWDLVTMQWL